MELKNCRRALYITAHELNTWIQCVTNGYGANEIKLFWHNIWPNQSSSLYLSSALFTPSDAKVNWEMVQSWVIPIVLFQRALPHAEIQ